MDRRKALLAAAFVLLLGSCDGRSGCDGPPPDDASDGVESSSATTSTTAAAPSPTAGATTSTLGSLIDTSSELLRLIEASTDGMVPPDKQVCYRDALLEVLPYGIDTVLEIPPTVDKDTLQQVLAKVGISVQQQGELLGNCMMAP